MNKKAAIEMSMQTIIVVVIGITLLTLGLRFVYTTFTDIGQQQRSVTEATEKQIRDLFGKSDQPLVLLSHIITVEQGRSVDMGVGIKNIGTQPGEFSYDLKMTAPEGTVTDEVALGWVSWTKDIGPLPVGGEFFDLITISVPGNAPPGSYRIRANLDCTPEETCGDGTSAIFVLRVTP